MGSRDSPVSVPVGFSSSSIDDSFMTVGGGPVSTWTASCGIESSFADMGDGGSSGASTGDGGATGDDGSTGDGGATGVDGSTGDDGSTGGGPVGISEDLTFTVSDGTTTLSIVMLSGGSIKNLSI